MLELRGGKDGYPGIPELEAGHNWGGVSAVDASNVRKRTRHEAMFVTGVSNIATHEIGHRALGPFEHTSGSREFMLGGGASEDSWLFDGGLSFTDDQRDRMKRRFNEEGEK
jgi:hypothetical protein